MFSDLLNKEYPDWMTVEFFNVYHFHGKIKAMKVTLIQILYVLQNTLRKSGLMGDW